MQLPSVDIIIGLIFLVGIGYGFLIKRDKAITTLCSIYMGMVIASSFSQTVYEFFNGNKTIANSVWIQSNASVSTIAIVILLLCVLFISGAINSSKSKSSDISPFEVIIYSILSVALILSSVLGYLPEVTRNKFIDTSTVAKTIYNFKTLITILPPLILVLMNIKKGK